MNRFFFYILFFGCFFFVRAENGYDLWLRYEKIQDRDLREQYLENFSTAEFLGDSPTLQVAKKELSLAHKGFFGGEIKMGELGQNTLLLGPLANLPQEISSQLKEDFKKINSEGYILKRIRYKGKSVNIITGQTDIGVLYGTFRFLREIQIHNDIGNLNIVDSPKIVKRILDHWDNLDGTVERGYAGCSIWNWQLLPDLIDQRYIDYARANASIGINGSVLTNVNANALVLTQDYIEKVKAMADAFRPYGIQVYLTARFSAPMEIGNLKTADPLDPEVRKWWKDKADEIYAEIPDFGGFLVKANSEGQPGPNNYGRSHAEGANMLAEAVAPHKGIIMWRAFVYSENDPEDRAKQAYSEFVPLDGKFADNVLLQVKNGAIDFQPREPFHPLFGAMPQTPLMMEFQITQEYLGFSSHLVFLPKLFEETLEADTFAEGKNSTVARIIDGSLYHHKLSGMAGVANIGSDINWTGHPFGQANWYGFGRLAWNPYLNSEEIAREWLKMTFSDNQGFVDKMTEVMLDSREAVVDYMTPLGLHHLMRTSHHYGPGPWVSDLSRPEWNPVYYHKADSIGIGFDRTKSGSDALSQYALPIQEEYGSLKTIPEEYLLWFHHVPWDYKMKDGNTLWYELALKYQKGVQEVESMSNTWGQMEKYVDEERFKKVQMLLKIQLKESKWWRDACLLYFQQFSKMDMPGFIPKPAHDLDYYESMKTPYAPGIRPSWK